MKTGPPLLLLQVPPFNAASCGATGGRIVRTSAGTGGSGTAFVPYASGSVGSARPSGQTSMCNRPRCTGTAFHLEERTRSVMKTRSSPDPHARDDPTCMGPFVGLEVGALGVDLFAAEKVALVHFPPPEAVRKVPQGTGQPSDGSRSAQDVDGKRRW